MLTFLTSLFTILVLMNLIASVSVLRAVEFEPNQKILQLVLVWLVPVFGAGGLMLFYWQDRRRVERLKLHGNLTSITERQAISHATAANHRGGR